MDQSDGTLFIRTCSEDAREQFTRQALPMLQSLLDQYGFHVMEHFIVSSDLDTLFFVDSETQKIGIQKF